MQPKDPTTTRLTISRLLSSFRSICCLDKQIKTNAAASFVQWTAHRRIDDLSSETHRRCPSIAASISLKHVLITLNASPAYLQSLSSRAIAFLFLLPSILQSALPPPSFSRAIKSDCCVYPSTWPPFHHTIMHSVPPLLALSMTTDSGASLYPWKLPSTSATPSLLATAS